MIKLRVEAAPASPEERLLRAILGGPIVSPLRELCLPLWDYAGRHEGRLDGRIATMSGNILDAMTAMFNTKARLRFK